MTREHPLQPFSPRNFGLGEDGKCVAPTSHDRRALAGAVKLGAAWTGKPGDAETAPGPFIDRPLPESTDETAPPTPEELIRFLRSPVQWFLERRIGLRLNVKDESLADREPITIGNLEEHGIGTDLLDWDVDGLRPADPEAVLRGGGRLPIGTPGRFELDSISSKAEEIAREVEKEISVRTEQGFVLHQYGKIKAHQRLRLWVHHLARTVEDSGSGEGVGTTRLLGGGERGGVEVMEVPAMDPAVARGHLEELARLFLSGQRVPLVFFPETSNAYALAYLDALDAGQDSADATRRAVHAAGALWTRQRKNGELYGDGTSVWVRRVMGNPAPCPAEPGFMFPGLEHEDVPTFHELALTVWTPLIELGVAGGAR